LNEIGWKLKENNSLNMRRRDFDC